MTVDAQREPAAAEPAARATAEEPRRENPLTASDHAQENEGKCRPALRRWTRRCW